MTRIGMKEAHMVEVGDLIHRVVAKGQDPHKVARDVAELKRGFQTIHYCFDEGHPAYHLWSLT